MVHDGNGIIYTWMQKMNEFCLFTQGYLEESQKIGWNVKKQYNYADSFGCCRNPLPTIPSLHGQIGPQ
jgi:hypothetical protein